MASDGPTVSFELRSLNSVLSCSLCNGYFRDPYTIMECLHTFCKTCLTEYFEAKKESEESSSMTCPRCGVDIGSDPIRNAVRPDRTLDSIMEKLFPASRPTLVRGSSNASQSSLSLKRSHSEDFSSSRSNTRVKRGEDITLELLYQPAAVSAASSSSSSSSASASASVPVPAPLAAAADDVDSKFVSLARPYIRTSSKGTVRLLKKYLSEILGAPFDQIDLSCMGEILGNDHTLEFIKKTRWPHSTPLQLNYLKKASIL